MSNAMIEITTSSSISVKAGRRSLNRGRVCMRSIYDLVGRSFRQRSGAKAMRAAAIGRNRGPQVRYSADMF